MKKRDVVFYRKQEWEVIAVYPNDVLILLRCIKRPWKTAWVHENDVMYLRSALM
jgi:hypothetical protein